MNFNSQECPVQSLVPHNPPMVLVDEILHSEEKQLIAKVTPAIGKPFADEQGNIPAWIGLEYLAQAIAAWSGWQGLQAGNPVQLGFLLGSRRYQANVSQFFADQPLILTVNHNYQEGGLAAFECTICLTDNTELVTASLNVYQPQPGDQLHDDSTR